MPASCAAVGVNTASGVCQPHRSAILPHCAVSDGKKAGAWGHAGCFSFFFGKNLGALGDGGPLVTNDGALADQVRELGN